MYEPKYKKMSAGEVQAETHSRWYDARMDGKDQFLVPLSFFWEMCCELDLWTQLTADADGNPATSYKGLKVYLEPVVVPAPVTRDPNYDPMKPPPYGARDQNLPDLPPLQPPPHLEPVPQATADMLPPLVVNPATGAPTPPSDVVINPLSGERLQKEIVINPVTGKPIQ